MIDVASLTADQWIALNPKGKINSVTINTTGNPVVNFTVTNPNGDPLKGLANYDSTPSTTTIHNYPNFYFELAKLVPGAPIQNVPPGFTPSKWVSYLVTSIPTKAKPNVAPSAPTSDQSGTLVQSAVDGSYTYTFYRAITGANSTASILAAATAAGKDVSALGDVSYDPTLAHRLSIEFYGNARGTGTGSHTNTPDGTGGTGVATEIANAINLVYDFTPGATGVAGTPVQAAREIVTVDTCNNCHSSLKYHGAHRVDARMCVTCHTDQRKYGATEATRDANGNITSASSAMINGGTSELDFPQLIHQIHMGDALKATGHDLETDTPGSVYNVRFPQSAQNCATCHKTQAASPQAGNWQTVPSREACGGCHDTVDFVAGTNHPAPGGAQPDDTKCVTCHSTGSITLNHAQVTPPDYTNGGLTVAQGGVASNTHTNASFVAGDTANLPVGAIAVTWNLKAVTVTAGVPSWTFNFLANGTPVVFNTFGTKTEMMDNFVGGPNLYLAYAVPQDGIAKPNDWNSTVSVNLHKLWRGGAAAGSSLTGPDANGLYTATLGGVTVPPNATMITGGIGYFYGVALQSAVAPAATDSLPLTQTNLTDYPFNSVLIKGVATAANWQGGLSVVAPNVWLKVAGQASRRAIVSNAKCNACHKNLGVFTEGVFHSGQRNDAPTCTFCHNVNGVDNGWGYNIKEAVHSLHSGGKRLTPYTWQAQLQYWALPYPAILNDCEACHVPGSYDFSASTNTAAVPNLLWTTVASGVINAAGIKLTDPTAYVAGSVYIAPWTTAGQNYGSGLYVNTTTAAVAKTWNALGTPAAVSVVAGATLEPDPQTLVNSPITSACYACHDSAPAKAHMLGNGGWLNTPRSTVTTAVAGVSTVAIVQSEQCLVCHGAGRTADIKAVHAF
jgi:OmcA/MtrC family decaheme c-type cytochrome